MIVIAGEAIWLHVVFLSAFGSLLKPSSLWRLCVTAVRPSGYCWLWDTHYNWFQMFHPVPTYCPFPFLSWYHVCSSLRHIPISCLFLFPPLADVRRLMEMVMLIEGNTRTEKQWKCAELGSHPIISSILAQSPSTEDSEQLFGWYTGGGKVSWWDWP